MSNSLSGRTILLTRPYQAALLDKKLIEKNQGNTLLVPLIDTIYVQNNKELEILSNLAAYSWIVFTSKNAAMYTMNVLEKKHLLNWLRKINIAAVGKKTSSYIEEKGFEVAFTPQSFKADDFIKEFPFEEVVGQRVLFPQGNLARRVVMNAFKQQKIECDHLILYHTIKPETSDNKLLHALQSEALDVITFASPSAVNNFVEIVKDSPILFQQARNGNWLIVSIGPTTSDELSNHGLPVHLESSIHTMAQMIEEIARFYMEQN